MEKLQIVVEGSEKEIQQMIETNIKGLYSIGDGGGLTTGLMMASASGVKMARILENK